MASLATGTDQVAGGGGQGAGQAGNSLFFLGLLLFLFTMILNVIGDFFVRRVRETVLMSASDIAITRDIVSARSLQGKRVDWRGNRASRSRCSGRC